MEKTLLSVIVPVYNAQAYLSGCLEALLGQTHQNLQILLVDDGSTDGSGAICDSFAVRDARVQVLHGTRAGVSAARNRGLACADGDYIAFADADDQPRPKMYATLLALAQKTSAPLAMCNFFWLVGGTVTENRLEGSWQDQGTLDGEALYEAVLPVGSFEGYVWNKLFHRSLVCGPSAASFDEDLRFGEDRLFTVRVLGLAGKAAFTRQALYGYRQGHGSVTRGNPENHLHFLRAQQRTLALVPPVYAERDRAHYIRLLIQSGAYAQLRKDRPLFASLQQDFAKTMQGYKNVKDCCRRVFTWKSRPVFWLARRHYPLGCYLWGWMSHMRKAYARHASTE